MTRPEAGSRPRSVAYVCAACGGEVVQPLDPGSAPASCAACGRAGGASERGCETGTGALSRCAHCGLDRLYVQKDFSKKTGLWIFVAAAALSVPTWGLSLLAATILDLFLYHALGDATLCYGCGAVHRGFRRNPEHGSFDIHVQELVDRRVGAAS